MDKMLTQFEICGDHKEWLDAMASKHGLPDADKALRVLLDFAIEDGNEAEIFENIRCRHC
jgi:hypothetical protein